MERCQWANIGVKRYQQVNKDMNELTGEVLINLLTKVSRGPNVFVNKAGNRVTDEVSLVKETVV